MSYNSPLNVRDTKLTLTYMYGDGRGLADLGYLTVSWAQVCFPCASSGPSGLRSNSQSGAALFCGDDRSTRDMHNDTAFFQPLLASHRLLFQRSRRVSWPNMRSGCVEVDSAFSGKSYRVTTRLGEAWGQ